MAKITEYSEATRFEQSDVLLKDGTNGTKKIAVENAAAEFAGLVSPIQHRNVYRGKNLGTSVTVAQKTAISNGTFDDLFVGDYWPINSIYWTIADIDYFLNIGDSNFDKHHLVVVPSMNLYNAKMNDANVTTGAYVGSKMYTDNLDEAKTKIAAAFGDIVQTHKIYLPNAVYNGVESAGAWVESTVDLMSEIMVYGSRIRNSGMLITSDKSQLALFQLNPKAVNTRETYWLRDVVSTTAFATVGRYGVSYHADASISLGVRPFFVIG